MTNYDLIEVRRGSLIGLFPCGTVVRLGEGIDTYQLLLPTTAVYMLRATTQGWEVYGFGAARSFQRTSWKAASRQKQLWRCYYCKDEKRTDDPNFVFYRACPCRGPSSTSPAFQRIPG